MFQEDHRIFIDFEPMTGSPLSARKRLQFNMFVFPIEKFKLMKTFPRALLPLFWVEEGIELGDDIINQLKSAFLMITVVRCIKWIMLLLGLGFGGAAGFLEYKRRQSEQKLQVTPVHREGSGDVKKWPAVSISTLQSAVVPPSVDRH